MDMRVCKRCKIEKELNKENFTPYTTSIGKKLFRLYCRKCHNNQNQKNFHENRDERNKKSREWYDENKETRSAQIKEYYNKVKGTDSFKKKQHENNKRFRDNNPEYDKKWYEVNKEKHKSLMRDFYENNPGYNSKIERERKKIDPFYALKKKLRNRTSMAFQYRGWKKTSKTQKMLGCDWDTLKSHLQQQFLDGMNWENQSEWHVDHIIPLNAAKNKDELYTLLYYKNLQPLWADDNISKKDNYDTKDKEKYLEWYSKNVKPLE
jgi:hypothetical protein